MSEVYWLIGNRIDLAGQKDGSASILGWLAKKGVQPRWIDQAHWLGSSTWAWPPTMAAFHWQPQPLLAHTLLDAAGRAILSGESQLILIGEEEGEKANLLILASPAAVGGYNLLPGARFTTRFLLNAGPDESIDLASGLATHLEHMEIEAVPVNLLAVSGNSGRLAPIPEEWKQVQPVPGGTVAQCNALFASLQLLDQQAGLLVSLLDEGPALVTLVERI